MSFFIPNRVKPENEKFYQITQRAYRFGLFHIGLVFGFYLLDIPEMMWFNLLISVPSFGLALALNRLGRHQLAFAIAFFELYVHQVLGTYYLGWSIGFQYFLVYLAGLSFFNPTWSRKFQVAVLVLIGITFSVLYLFFQNGVYTLPPALVDSFFLSGAITAILVLTLLINRYSVSGYQAEEALKKANDELGEKNKRIEHQHEQILSSISYAERIQKAVIPVGQLLEQRFEDHFISFKPRDIVSGDFYWFGERDGKTIIICADCTGHGVPGAFMSMLGITLIEDVIMQQGLLAPEEILERLREGIKKSFRQNEQQDGMDASVCVFDHEQRELTFAGANNGVFLLRNDELMELKPVKNPVGHYLKERPFTAELLSLEAGDQIYLYTDGYIDQFGGPEDRKFNRKQMKTVLLANSHLPMAEQQVAFERSMESWQAETPQTDDCTLIGVRV
ncbi:MAG TPA: hypothetical protein DCE41_15125 [Cytophagales bacterium]|nr:hypothetical protein [Cytophagales bacterium]HAA18490.1 hypothetical protein [Cytophagales bacterium]HAP61961.1 hypothetical protein [Cytophagales bacterium]